MILDLEDDGDLEAELAAITGENLPTGKNKPKGKGEDILLTKHDKLKNHFLGNCILTAVLCIFPFFLSFMGITFCNYKL